MITGRRMSDDVLHTIVRELANHEVRIESTEKILSEQTKVLKSIERKFTWGGGVVATLVFLMTPMGVSLWKLLTGL